MPLGEPIHLEATNAADNLCGSALDADWIRAVPLPPRESDGSEAFFREKRSVLSSLFTAFVVLGTFTLCALAFATLAFDAMGIHP